MASPNPLPWFNRPARPFPALVWLGQHYPFVISASIVARYPARPTDLSTPQRPFPALVWVVRQQVARLGQARNHRL